MNDGGEPHDGAAPGGGFSASERDAELLDEDMVAGCGASIKDECAGFFPGRYF